MDQMDPNYKEGMELVKDRYGSERRKAKILNFSLAYGKTEYGLSKDFGVSLDEAKKIVERWYKSRPEVCSIPASAIPLLLVRHGFLHITAACHSHCDTLCCRWQIGKPMSETVRSRTPGCIEYRPCLGATDPCQDTARGKTGWRKVGPPVPPSTLPSRAPQPTW